MQSLFKTLNLLKSPIVKVIRPQAPAFIAGDVYSRHVPQVDLRMRARHNGADWQDYGAKKRYDGATKNMNGDNLPVCFYRSMGLILQVSLYFLADKNTKHI